jgi:aspartate 1-decarboxylase
MGIDLRIMKAANIVPGEKVQVLNYNNGERLETYTIAEKAGSRRFVLYGPASHKGKVGDRLCILSYALVQAENVGAVKPSVITLNERNQLKRKPT